MSDRWKLGNYEFVINPRNYGEQVNVVGDTVVTLGGNVISQPTTLAESYSMTSTFYQNRPKITNIVSVPNLGGVELLSGNYYILNNTTKKIDVYNSNLSSLTKSVSLVTTPNGEDFKAFDVQSDGTIWAVEAKGSTDILHKITPTGTMTTSNFTSLTGRVVGIKYDSGNFWVVTSGGNTLYQLDSLLQVQLYLTLPYMNPSKLGYEGITLVNGYIVVAFNNTEETGAYFIDSTNGNICNAFTLPDYIEVTDVAYNGTSYIFSTRNGNQLYYTNGNTLLLDIHNLEKEIKTKGFISMVDDMGVSRRVMVKDYNVDRLEGFLQRYDITINAYKVDRGIA